MIRSTAFFMVGVLLLTAACGGQTGGEAAENAQAAVEKAVDPALRAKADAYVAACSGAVAFGAKTTAEQCACFGEAVLDYIDPEGAAAFFDGISPLYAIEDKKRRDDAVDRYFRDLIVNLTGETRPSWDAMFTEAFPVCRGDD